MISVRCVCPTLGMDSNANVYRGFTWLNELEIIVFPGTTLTLVCIFFLYLLLLNFLTAQTSSSLRYQLRCKFYYNFVCFLPNYTIKFNTNLQYCSSKSYISSWLRASLIRVLSFTNLFWQKMIIFLCCCLVLQNDVFLLAYINVCVCFS